MIRFPFRGTAAVAASLLSAGMLTAAVATPCDAQPREEREVRITRAPGGRMALVRGAPVNRAVLGVVLADGSLADTAGVRIESVGADSPAAKAGLKAGDVITAINGVSLTLARADAEDPALSGLAQRRLQRVMSRVTPGEAVTLQVHRGGATRSVAVTTASTEALERRRRGAVGVSIGSAGNARDTLGLFVNSVVSGGAAEKAGIIEGERIAAVNGMDVRVPRDDVDDGEAVSARVERFVREIQTTEPGQTVVLRVWGNGRYRDVHVTVQTADELPGTMIERAMEEMGRRVQDRLREVEIDVRGLRTLPERSGAVRVRVRAGRVVL